MITLKTRVVVGMSGDVDPSVTALLLKNGATMVGIFAEKNWDDTDVTASVQRPGLQGCGCGGRLAAFLTTLSILKKSTGTAFLVFLAEYRAGRTPNRTLVLTKSEISGLLDYAMTLGYLEYVATGHYAR